MNANLRLRPLLVEIGSDTVSLLSNDLSVLVLAIDAMIDGLRKADVDQRPGLAEAREARIGDLETLRGRLMSPPGSALDPLTLDAAQTSLLRSVLADITGYQRRDLTPGLRELRQIL